MTVRNSLSVLQPRGTGLLSREQEAEIEDMWPISWYSSNEYGREDVYECFVCATNNGPNSQLRVFWQKEESRTAGWGSAFSDMHDLLFIANVSF